MDMVLQWKFLVNAMDLIRKGLNSFSKIKKPSNILCNPKMTPEFRQNSNKKVKNHPSRFLKNEMLISVA